MIARLLLLSFFLALANGMLPTGVLASDEETDSPEGTERERVYVVPVQPEEGSGFQVDRIVIEANGRRLGVSASAGVVRESQDRIRLRGIPVIGNVFLDRLARADFSPERAVGNVYVEDRSLLVELRAPHQDLWFDTVVLVHGKFSYRFQDELAAVAAATPTDPERPVGTAFAKEDTLLVLIRPSVITDSLLDF